MINKYIQCNTTVLYIQGLFKYLVDFYVFKGRKKYALPSVKIVQTLKMSF